MARKTAIHTTNAEVRLAEYKADAKLDKPAKSTKKTLIPTLADIRAAKDFMAPRELVAVAQSAARLELRGSTYSPDDRADVAATIVAAILAEVHSTAPTTVGATGDVCMPRRDDERVTLHACCLRARNLRRSIDARRKRDDAETKRQKEREATLPGALGISDTKAKHAAIVARSSLRCAELAATAICRDLLPNLDRLDGPDAWTDTPAWSALYAYVRGETAAVCGTERGTSENTFKQRASRGAKFIQGFYSLGELADRLLLGASNMRAVGTGQPETYRCGISAHEYTDVYGPVLRAPSEVWDLVLEDISRDARHHTPIMADSPKNWREPHYDRPETADEARELCKLSRCRKRTSKLNAPDRAEHVSHALVELGRAYAAGSNRRERATARKSALID